MASGTKWSRCRIVLMQQARSAKDHAPIKAAVTAQLAVAVAILTFAPVRLSNLVSIELGKNLIKPGGLNTPYWLVFPHYDVKNRVDLNFQFDQPLTDLIDEYIHEFRPALLRGSNASWLFPGEGGEPKTAITFSAQITKRIEKAVGLRITLHQFRHAAAAIYLKHRPGDYETVRRVLGHRSIETTINFYCGLQTMQATEQFGKLIRQQIKFDADYLTHEAIFRDDRITTRSGQRRARSARCRWISGRRLIVMHGMRPAGLLRASSAEVWPAISSRSHATTMLGTTAASSAFSTGAACSDQTDRLRRM